jgi:hypothetical protein
MLLLLNRAHRPIEHEDAVTEDPFERAALFVRPSYSVTTLTQLGGDTCDRGNRHQTMPCPDELRLLRNIFIARVTDSGAEGTALMPAPRESPLFHSDLAPTGRVNLKYNGAGIFGGLTLANCSHRLRPRRSGH